jgi:hypothetical protein
VTAAALDGKLSNSDLHQCFLRALGAAVVSHGDIENKPLEIDLKGLLPPKVRVYIYNATYPPGGRAMGEHKIQLIVPGQERNERGNFDASGGRIPLLVGYRPDLELFILWDADLYVDFAYSRNVQVKPETIYEAFAQGIGRQTRSLRVGEKEIVIVADPRHLAAALIERQGETLKRLLRGNR